MLLYTRPSGYYSVSRLRPLQVQGGRDVTVVTKDTFQLYVFVTLLLVLLMLLLLS